MEERQISIDGETHPLPPPYFVIATQNPVETQGTFPLPEAQLDRFMLQLDLGYPTREGEAEIIGRFLRERPLEKLSAVSSAGAWVALQESVRTVRVHPDLRTYIADLAAFTRRHEHVALGVSPRASLALARAAQGYAALRGRDYAVPEDIKYLAPYAWPHRLLLRGAARANAKGKALVISEALGRVPVPTEDMWDK
jgi:MoxR-like ATPase